ncbi:MAG: hypothetical protein V3T86_02700 [Planctomycetota bacterium]
MTASASPRITPASSKRDQKIFRLLPDRLHGSYPAYIPMLRMSVAAVLDRKRNPYWKSAEACEWIAWRGSQAVGRIGACVDEHLKGVMPGMGAVGFFDCEDDAETARALFATAESWLKERGITHARGPLNYCIHDTAGVLVEGFDTPPAIDTTWNPSYYGALFEQAGYIGAMDMLATAGPLEYGGPNRLEKFANLARKRGVTVRTLDYSDFDAEAERLRVVYNEAWSENWGHVPIPKDEFLHKARDMKMIMHRDLVMLAEKDGDIVGLVLLIPDLNTVSKRFGGKLLPFGWWHLLRAKHVESRVRCVLLGVVPSHRVRGTVALLLEEVYTHGLKRYHTWAEASWVLADNKSMLNALALHHMVPYKRWRLYEKALAETAPQAATE